MRSCIYCGKELEKGEVCNCAQSAVRRQANQNNGNTNSDKTYRANSSGYENTQYGQTSYRTGYTRKESKLKRAWERFKMKRAIRRANTSSRKSSQNLIEVIKGFIKSPVETIINPPYIGMGAMIALSAIQGAVVWLCIYFIMNNVSRGLFSTLASLMAFNGTRGYMNLLNICMAALSGAVTGIILFFIYSGIFYFINRVIFRQNSSFGSFSQRLVLACIPTTIIGIIGTLLSFLSSITLFILLLCGAVSWVILTYEALRQEWTGNPYGKIMYAMMLGFFVFFSIICYLVMLA